MARMNAVKAGSIEPLLLLIHRGEHMRTMAEVSERVFCQNLKMDHSSQNGVSGREFHLFYAQLPAHKYAGCGDRKLDWVHKHDKLV
jgi:hypothetical protein